MINVTVATVLINKLESIMLMLISGKGAWAVAPKITIATDWYIQLHVSECPKK